MKKKGKLEGYEFKNLKSKKSFSLHLKIQVQFNIIDSLLRDQNS